MAAASSYSHTALRARSAALNGRAQKFILVSPKIQINSETLWGSNTSAAPVKKEKKYLLLGVCLTLYYQPRSEEQ